jgi:hypothetical protein
MSSQADKFVNSFIKGKNSVKDLIDVCKEYKDKCQEHKQIICIYLLGIAGIKLPYKLVKPCYVYQELLMLYKSMTDTLEIGTININHLKRTGQFEAYCNKYASKDLRVALRSNGWKIQQFSTDNPGFSKFKNELPETASNFVIKDMATLLS